MPYTPPEGLPPASVRRPHQDAAPGGGSYPSGVRRAAAGWPSSLRSVNRGSASWLQARWWSRLNCAAFPPQRPKPRSAAGFVSVVWLGGGCGLTAAAPPPEWSVGAGVHPVRAVAAADAAPPPVVGRAAREGTQPAPVLADRVGLCLELGAVTPVRVLRRGRPGRRPGVEQDCQHGREQQPSQKFLARPKSHLSHLRWLLQPSVIGRDGLRWKCRQ